LIVAIAPASLFRVLSAIRIDTAPCGREMIFATKHLFEFVDLSESAPDSERQPPADPVPAGRQCEA